MPRKTANRQRTKTRIMDLRREISGMNGEIASIQRQCRHKWKFLRWETGNTRSSSRMNSHMPRETLVKGTYLLGSECGGIDERTHVFKVMCGKCGFDERKSSLSTCPKCCSKLVRKRKVNTNRYIFSPDRGYGPHGGLPGWKLVLHECGNEDCKFRGVTIERDPKHVHNADEPF